MPVTLPELFGRYRIVRKLGEGGMGAVYLAEDTGPLRRQVAIKVPHFEPGENPQVIERFYREARIAAQIHHANLCPIHEVGCIDGTHYLAMALIDGQPLSAYISPDRPWPPEQAAALVRQLAGVLHLLHQRGIIHRDLKPANVMIQADGSPVLMDFGLAKSLETDGQPLTRLGQALGTPAYMAPEQNSANASALGPHTDVWALGVILYQLLTGQLPFQGTPGEVYGRILAARPAPPSELRPGIPPAIEAACLSALAKEPGRRPATMRAFAQLLAPPSVLRTSRVNHSSGLHPAAARTRAVLQNTLSTRHANQGAPLSTPSVPPTTRPSFPPGTRAFFLGMTLLLAIAGPLTLWLALSGATSTAEDLTSPTRSTGSSSSTPPQARPTPEDPTGPTGSTVPEVARLRLLPLEEVELTAGEERKLPVRIERERCDGEVVLTQVGSVDSLHVSADPIPSDSSTGTLHLRARKEAREGRHVVKVLALGPSGVVAEGTVTVALRSPSAAPVASLKIQPLLELSLTPGESRTLTVTIERTNYDGQVNLSRQDWNPDIQMDLAPIPAGTDRVSITIKTTTRARGRHTLGLTAIGPGKVGASQTLVVTVGWPKLKNSIGMELTLIPEGMFMMGSPPGEGGRQDAEGPQHEVKITTPFYLGVYEVTQEEYEKVMGTNPSAFSAEGIRKERVKGLNTRRFPVDNVSHDLAVEFCKRLAEREEEKEAGRSYRLPTEAEWEYACRGGAPSYKVFHFGDSLESSLANFDGRFPYFKHLQGGFIARSLQRTVAVDDSDFKYRPNGFDLYHMHGNVWEWCSDWYDPKYYQICLDKNIRNNPPGPDQSPDKCRVLRGGSWNNYGSSCRSALRSRSDPGRISSNYGFRVVCVKSR